MISLVWNVRGAASDAFRRTFKDMMKQHKPDLAILLETKCSGDTAKKVIQHLGFTNFIIKEAQGFVGESHRQYIHVKVQYQRDKEWFLMAVTSDCRKLIAMPTKMEIRRAIFSIGSLKVPGSDGLPSLIYKNNWEIMKGKLLVWEWTKQNGKWDIDKFNQNLPPEIVMEIICKPPPQAENDDDRRGWRPSHDGNFSINSTYKELRKWPSEEKTVWKQLWSWRGPQRAKIFLWTAMHKKLMTNQRRARIFGGVGDCTRCNGGQEDIFHVLRNCPKASTIWVNLVKTDEIPNFFQLEWDNWIETNL
ncbi:hypothetical protein Ahy_B08g092538 [Arachis hypogaea]|uniref:Reverse transcriptase zinc-binding domain-containing protein n=1 Tax=Arachis hypogaea TaxID=3818 RepID=A0A444Y451_ARAHY|nr:hypothetical protein Ahy_B08g092538 [Arachis hypogaea]